MKFIKSNISRTIFKVEGCKKFIFTDLAARSLETFRKSALPRKMIHFLAPQSITGIVSLYGGKFPRCLIALPCPSQFTASSIRQNLS